MSDIDEAKSGPKPPGRLAAATALEGGMTELVIGRALLRVLQDLIGLGDFLELVLRLLVARVLVGMMFLGELAKRGFEVLSRSRLA